MTVAGQPTVNYQYDANSRLTNLVIASGAWQSLSFGFAYDALGRRTSLSLPNGVTTNYTYDNGSNLLNIESLNPLNAILEKINYTYDSNGNRTSMDRLNVQPKLPNPASNISYNAANQMLTFNDKNISYDDNGNMTTVTNSCGTTTYIWNARNQLAGIQGFNSDCSALSANFKYDALGRRVEKTINGRTIQYLYDGLDIIQEIENGTVTVNYIRTLNIDDPLARIKSDGSIRYYQQDALGSVIGLTTENAQLATVYSYDPFGNVTISGEASENPFQFAGRENDGNGYLFERNRYYSFELQRYISPDPIGLAGGDVNFYVRVGNDPMNRIDPLGLKCKRPFWGRALDNFVLTNKTIPGVLAPAILPGVGIGLLTSGKVAELTGGITVLEWAWLGFRGATLQGVAFTGLETGAIAAGTAALNFAAVGLSFEAGVGVGSIISAAIFPCEEEIEPSKPKGCK